MTRNIWLVLNSTQHLLRKYRLPKLDYPLAYPLPSACLNPGGREFVVGPEGGVIRIGFGLCLEVRKAAPCRGFSHDPGAGLQIRPWIGVHDNRVLACLREPTYRDWGTSVYYGYFFQGCCFLGQPLEEGGDPAESALRFVSHAGEGQERAASLKEYFFAPGDVIEFFNQIMDLGAGDLFFWGEMGDCEVPFTGDPEDRSNDFSLLSGKGDVLLRVGVEDRRLRQPPRELWPEELPEHAIAYAFCSQWYGDLEPVPGAKGIKYRKES